MGTGGRTWNGNPLVPTQSAKSPSTGGTRADCILIYDNPKRFPGLATRRDGYEVSIIKTKVVTLPLGIEHLFPCSFKLCVSLMLEYILGVDVLQGLNLQTSAGEFCLLVGVAKTRVPGHMHYLPQKVPEPRYIVNVKQYCLPGGTTKYHSS